MFAISPDVVMAMVSKLTVKTEFEIESPQMSSRENENEFKDKNGSGRLHVLLLTFASIFIYLFDLGSDFYQAEKYRRGGKYTEGVATILATVFPSLLILFFILACHRSKNETDKSTVWKIIVIIGSLLHIIPLLAMVEYLWYGIRQYFSGKRNSPLEDQDGYGHDSRRILRLMAAIAIIQLIGSFAEAIPQITTQIYIVFKNLNEPNGSIQESQIFTIVTSLISCSWSICFAYMVLVSGSPIKEATEEENQHVSLLGLWGPMFCGYLSIISSRFFVLEFMMLTSWPLFFAFCSSHWIFLFIWDILKLRNSTWASPGASGNYHRAVVSPSPLVSCLVRNFLFVFVFFDFIMDFKKFCIINSIIFIENILVCTFCVMNIENTFMGQSASNVEFLKRYSCYIILGPPLVMNLGIICLQWHRAHWGRKEIGIITRKKQTCALINELLLFMGVRPNLLNPTMTHDLSLV